MLKYKKINIHEKNFLHLVEQKVKHNLKSHNYNLPFATKTLYSASKYLCINNKAKRERPLLTMLFGDVLNFYSPKLINLATACELIHSASLMHDDVIDNATTRRGKTSTNIQYSNSTAVLTGNFLWSRAFLILKNLPEEIIYQAVNVISDMTHAAIAEIEIRAKLNVTLNMWKKIAIKKTGVLFSWCGYSVGYLANDLDSAKKFYKCGCHLGTVFQMANDLRDLNEKYKIKDLYSDLKNKEPSYPIILGLKNSKLAIEINKLWTNSRPKKIKIAKVANMLINSGVIENTLKDMLKEIDKAAKSLGNLIQKKGAQKIINWAHLLYKQVNKNFC